jgi:hypothetical protein
MEWWSDGVMEWWRDGGTEQWRDGGMEDGRWGMGYCGVGDGRWVIVGSEAKLGAQKKDQGLNRVQMVRDRKTSRRRKSLGPCCNS